MQIGFSAGLSQPVSKLDLFIFYHVTQVVLINIFYCRLLLVTATLVYLEFMHFKLTRKT
jgi:hypothetical protein